MPPCCASAVYAVWIGCPSPPSDVPHVPRELAPVETRCHLRHPGRLRQLHPRPDRIFAAEVNNVFLASRNPTSLPGDVPNSGFAGWSSNRGMSGNEPSSRSCPASSRSSRRSRVRIFGTTPLPSPAAAISGGIRPGFHCRDREILEFANQLQRKQCRAECSPSRADRREGRPAPVRVRHRPDKVASLGLNLARSQATWRVGRWRLRERFDISDAATR